MIREEYNRLRKMLMWGIVFSLVTIIGGELPIGWTVYPTAENEMMTLLLGSGNLSLLQLACGIFFGGVGIPLQYIGYRAIAEIVEKGACKRCARLIEMGAKAIAWGGGSLHMMCVALMFVCKMGDLNHIMDFMMWLVLPFTAVFMLLYIPMTIALMISVGKGKTIFPKWAVIFNPLVYKILINGFAAFAPNVAWMNAVRMSNMGIGSLMTFVGLMTLLTRNWILEQQKEEKVIDL